MNIAFTICSNNYLAHAKTLGDSFLEHHPDWTFIIGLVDQLDESFDYSFFKNFTIIPVTDIVIPQFEELCVRYNITELNTAVKPSYLHHIFTKYSAKKVLYIDPDILVTSPFVEVIDALDTKNIVITPHMCSPVDDGFSPTDHDVLGGGVYNLGFIGLSDYAKIKTFINWWDDRVIKYGYCNQNKGMFYDQLWINYVPCFFDNYYILKHLGYNMANWNLHERTISIIDDNLFVVNELFTLRFFHFSSFKFNKPDVICWYQNRYDFNSRPDLKPIFNRYIATLKENKIAEISKLDVFYYPNLHQLEPELEPKKRSVKKEIICRTKKALKILIKGHA